jgi:hypothetical protein
MAATMVGKSTEVKKVAERRIGQLMEGLRKAGLMEKGGGAHRDAQRPDAPKSLAAQGVDKHLGDRRRTLPGYQP